MFAAICAGILVGFCLPVQTSVNVRLRARLGSPVLASLVSFAVATVFLAVLVLAEKGSLLLPLADILREPLWIWGGGICGVIFLTGNILLLPRIGSVQTVILPVLGQVVMGLLIDNFAWFASREIPLTLYRALGAILVVGGVTVVSMSGRQEQIGTSSGSETSAQWFWRLFAIGTGMLSATQTAINGHLGSVVNSPYRAALISFLVGLALLPLACAFWSARYPTQADRLIKMRWWMWTGGIFGALYILVNVFLAQAVGTGAAVTIVLAGAITGGVVIDHFALLGSRERRPLTFSKALGLVGIVLGVICVRLL